MRFTSCIPALDMLTSPLVSLSKPVGPSEPDMLCISFVNCREAFAFWRSASRHFTFCSFSKIVFRAFPDRLFFSLRTGLSVVASFFSADAVNQESSNKTSIPNATDKGTLKFGLVLRNFGPKRFAQDFKSMYFRAKFIPNPSYAFWNYPGA